MQRQAYGQSFFNSSLVRLSIWLVEAVIVEKKAWINMELVLSTSCKCSIASLSKKKCTSIEKWSANAITNSQSWVLMLLAMYVPKQKILVWKHSVIKAAQWLHTYSMQP